MLSKLATTAKLIPDAWRLCAGSATTTQPPPLLGAGAFSTQPVHPNTPRSLAIPCARLCSPELPPMPRGRRSSQTIRQDAVRLQEHQRATRRTTLLEQASALAAATTHTPPVAAPLPSLPDLYRAAASLG